VRLDAEAKAAYLARLRELEEEASEAEAWNDGERTARAQQEIAFLTDELKSAVGLGGRDRREASAAATTTGRCGGRPASRGPRPATWTTPTRRCGSSSTGVPRSREGLQQKHPAAAQPAQNTDA